MRRSSWIRGGDEKHIARSAWSRRPRATVCRERQSAGNTPRRGWLRPRRRPRLRAKTEAQQRELLWREISYKLLAASPTGTSAIDGVSLGLGTEKSDHTRAGSVSRTPLESGRCSRPCPIPLADFLGASAPRRGFRRFPGPRSRGPPRPRHLADSRVPGGDELAGAKRRLLEVRCIGGQDLPPVTCFPNTRMDRMFGNS